MYGSTNDTNASTLTAVAVTPRIRPHGIPYIREPDGDDDDDTETVSSIPATEPDDELDLSLQTPSAPRDEYSVEDELEPDYISDAASDVGSVAASLAASDVAQKGAGAEDAAIEGDITKATAVNTEASPETKDGAAKKGEPAKNDGAAKKDATEIEDESKFIDNLIDNAKSKVDDCTIS